MEPEPCSAGSPVSTKVRTLGSMRGAAAASLLLLSACLVEIVDPLPVDGTGGSTANAMGGESTTGGDGGMAGSEGGSAGAGGSTSACPAEMIHIQDDALDADFCIDATEVTQASYVQFLIAVGNQVPSGEPPECSGNASLTHTPDGTCPDFTTASQLPVYCVDWCDAHAFCRHNDKRLCRALAGSAMALDDDPVIGEWHFACTGGLMTAYPYGNDPIDGECHIDDQLPKEEVALGGDCEGGYPGIFDMQGNVHEWVDACTGTQCRIRGGGTYGAAVQWSCNRMEAQMIHERLDNDDRTIGIRCCRDAD